MSIPYELQSARAVGAEARMNAANGRRVDEPTNMVASYRMVQGYKANVKRKLAYNKRVGRDERTRTRMKQIMRKQVSTRYV